MRRGFVLFALLCAAAIAGGKLPVLVLGSGGFLGSRVLAHLRSRNHSVSEVRGRAHVDLRSPSALASFAAAHGPFSTVIFLACEVGGAKFLNAPASQADIVRNNVQIFESVFPWARASGVRVLYAGSYMRHLPDAGAYAAVKALGEEYLAALLPVSLGLGVRLWNLYGREVRSLKSHVLSDWAAQCVRAHAIESTSSARERRQFLHVDDAAAALVGLVEHWADAAAAAERGGAGVDARMLDVSSGEWSRLTDVAEELSVLATEEGFGPCPLVAALTDAPFRQEVSPRPHSPLADAWEMWLPRELYPGDAIARTAVQRETGGIGWITRRDGLVDLLRFHAATAARASTDL